LDVADALSESCVERVRASHADLALAAVRASAPELLAEPFCSDAFHLVRLRDLAGEPFIQLGPHEQRAPARGVGAGAGALIKTCRP
jgi:hypothetical protein